MLNLIYRTYNKSIPVDENIFSYLIILFPFFLLTGPFLTDFVVSLSSLYILFKIFQKKLWYIFKNNFFVFLFVFNIYIILVSLKSDNVLLSLESSLFYIRFLFFAFLIYYLLEVNKLIFKNLYYLLFFIIIFLFFDSTFQYFYGQNFFGFRDIHAYRLSGIFKDEYILGSYISRLMPILIALFFFIFKNKINWQLYVILIFCGIMCYLSGERTAMFIYLSFLFFMLLFLREIRVKIFMILSVLLLALTIFSMNDKNLYERAYIKSINSFFPEDGIKIYSYVHESLFETSFNMFIQNKYFGVGPKLFRIKCSEEKYNKYIHESLGCSTHPHNIYLQLLSETGLIGAGFLLIIFVFLLYQFFRVYFKSLSEFKYSILSLYTILLLNLFPLIPSGNFFNNYISAIYYFPIGITLYFYYLINIHKHKKNEMN